MAFHFFTEPLKLQNQTALQAFGAVDENNYRLGNMFTASSDAMAFAITGGNVLVQEVNSTTVNIVLKPDEQPNIDLPKIDYIIYKGIVKNSLVNGTIVADLNNNDLTKRIWNSNTNALNAGMPDTPNEPIALSSLGLGYSATATDDYKALDNDSLNLAFYHPKNKLTKVESGFHIGDFQASEFGIVIVLQKIGFEPTFKLARELDSKIHFDSSVSNTATNADKFKRKHDKEAILAYLDSAAFFSSFNGTGINVSTGGANFEEKTAENFYLDVTQKHHNKNILYLDIRNENLDSFNYYENYDNNINLDLTGNNIYSEKNYYGNTWPILTINNNEFDAINTEKSISLGLKKGDNEFPHFFLKKGNLLNITEEELQKPSTRFLDILENEEDTYYNISNKLQVPKTDTGIIKTNYFQLRYIKRYATPDSNYTGLSLKNESYLDNLFPIFDMKLPFVNEGSVNIKMFNDASYIDKTNINEIDFTTNIGIATDEQNISFIAFPNIYNEADVNSRGKVPLYSEQAFNGDTFLRHFNKKVEESKIINDLFQTSEDNYEFLAFPNTLDEVVLEQPENDVITDNLTLEKTILDIDSENINILALTRDQYTQLESIKNTEFTSPYKVYLGIANTDYLTLDEDSVATTFYALRGIRENDSGELEAHEYITDIKLFAQDDLYNWDSAREKKCIIKFVKKEPEYTNGDYGFDWLRSNYKNICESNYNDLKNTYALKQIAGKDYYIPWLSMRLNQTVTLKLDKTFRKKNEFTTIKINPNPNFTITPINFKTDSEVTITCIKESPDPTMLIVLADGVEAGAINIIHKPFKKIEFKWVFVEWRGTNIDENALTTKVSLTNIRNYIKKGLNPALLEEQLLNTTPEILDIADLWANRNTQPANIKSIIETKVANIQATFDGVFTPGQNNIPKIEGTIAKEISFLTNLYALYSLQKQLNNIPPVFDVITIFFGEMTCINATGGEINGFSFTGGGVSMMNVQNPTTKLSRDLSHEALHAIDLHHSFDNTATHYFKKGRTDNIMDYDNTPKNTWKWQWDDLYNSQYAKNI